MKKTTQSFDEKYLWGPPISFFEEGVEKLGGAIFKLPFTAVYKLTKFTRDSVMNVISLPVSGSKSKK